MSALISSLVVVVSSLCMLLVMNYALEPMNILTRAITVTTDQPHDNKPPNLNGTRHEQNGLKMMVDHIYSLSVTGPRPGKSIKNEALFSAVLESVPCGIIALNEKREVVYANSQAPVKKNDKGMTLELIFDGENNLESWLDKVEQTNITAYNLWHRVADSRLGTEGRKLYDTAVTYNRKGAAGIETVIAVIDRTGTYGVDEENMDFIALAAHELRGPVTVIHGYLDILQRELELTDAQRALFDRLEVSANRLSSYIGNILNASKYDRRHLKIHLHEDKIQNVYAQVADDLMLRAQTNNRILSVEIPIDLPTIAADRNSLGEVIANYVDNAIKYSNEGGQINIKATASSGFVTVSVTDTGIGIPASLVGHLFTKFYRSHRSRQSVAGTGLGLYISKAIIESHGGKVSVSSKEGEGSTFSFTVPIYSTVKDKLLANNNENQGIIETSSGWIKNHAKFQG